MKCIITGGFLGSGKTSFINSLLKYAREYYPDSKTALLINEFGEIPVDPSMMDVGNYSLREVTGGCICCTLKGMLADAVAEIREREKPDLLIVEATGLAVPSEIAASVGPAGGCSAFTMLCVDPWQYNKLAGRLAIYDRQLADADIIMLTKGDIRDGELLEEVRAGLNDEFAARPCFDERKRMFHHLFSDLAGIEKPLESPLHEHNHRHHQHEKHELKEDICQITKRISGVTDIAELEAALSAAVESAGPDLYRTKGIIKTVDGWKAIQFADGEMNTRGIEQPENGDSFIVFIGKCETVEEIRL